MGILYQKLSRTAELFWYNTIHDKCLIAVVVKNATKTRDIKFRYISFLIFFLYNDIMSQLLKECGVRLTDNVHNHGRANIIISAKCLHRF